MGLQIFKTPLADFGPALLDQDTKTVTIPRWIRPSIGGTLCVLWLVVASAEDKAMCGEASIGVQALVASMENRLDLREPQAMWQRREPLTLSQLAETALEQKPDAETGPDSIDNQGPEASEEQSAPVSPSVPIPEQALQQAQEKDATEVVSPSSGSKPGELAADAEKTRQQALDQERVRVDALVRGLALLAAELEKARIVGVEAIQAVKSETRQREALEQEHDRAEELAREVSSLQAELKAAQAANLDEAQVAEAEAKQKQALAQEQARAEALSLEAASLRAELESARAASSEAALAAAADTAQKQALELQVSSLRAELDSHSKPGPQAAQAAMAEVEHKQALELELNQERDKALAVARELSSLQEELATTRAAGLEAVRAAEAAKAEHQLAFNKERAKTEALARELASARKEAEERSARLAAAHAEALQVADDSGASLAEQKRALAGERDRADALARELMGLKNQLESDKKQIAGLNALAIPSSREPADTSASTRGPDPSMRMETTGADARSHVDEQRLLARASALLRQADISGARPLLEHALEHGSARAAFMLAETYDRRVLESWRARGISGDVAKARKLYERAQAGGIEDARQRIEALR